MRRSAPLGFRIASSEVAISGEVAQYLPVVNSVTAPPLGRRELHDEFEVQHLILTVDGVAVITTVRELRDPSLVAQPLPHVGHALPLATSLSASNLRSRTS
jgi:hypothetical protein